MKPDFKKLKFPKKDWLDLVTDWIEIRLKGLIDD
jgi:hypothetical protein